MIERNLAIVMPAFNARPTITPTISRIPADRLPAFIVLIVDDGSNDGTGEEATATCMQKGLDFEVIRHERNRGYGAAQKTGLNRALSLGCKWSVLLHSDGQYAPEELPEMIKPLISGEADVVVGSRILAGALKQGMPFIRWLGNRVISALENAIFGLHFVEYHSGAMAYSDTALKAIKFDTLTDRFHFDGEMLLCAGKIGLRVREVPISTYFGPDVSSLRPIPYMVEIAGVITRYIRRGYFFQKAR